MLTSSRETGVGLQHAEEDRKALIPRWNASPTCLTGSWDEGEPIPKLSTSSGCRGTYRGSENYTRDNHRGPEADEDMIEVQGPAGDDKEVVSDKGDLDCRGRQPSSIGRCSVNTIRGRRRRGTA